MNLQTYQWPMADGTLVHVEIKEQNKSRWLVVTHGLGEHGGRHHYLASLFKDDYNIVWWDLRGHGQSHGRRCFVDKFEQYAQDLKEVINRLAKDFHLQHFSLLGHSMGASVTADYMQNLASESLYPEKVFLSAPPISLPGPGGWLVKYAPVEVLETLAHFPLSAAIPGMINPKGLSHDPKIDKDYVNDPLNCRALHSRLAFNLCLRAREVFSRPLRIQCPSYCVYGTKDPIVDPNAIAEYFSKHEKNTEVMAIAGGYHELHNETPDYRRPFIDFLTSRLRPQASVLD